MNIGNKYLRSWLRFEESATKDFIADNQWIAYGTPSIDSSNAINGNALQLDGNSYLKLQNVDLAKRDFTIDCWLYMDSSSPNRARVFSIVNPDNGNHLLSVRKSADYPNNLDVWINSYADVSVDYGYTYRVNANAVNNRVHVALTYEDRGTYAPLIYLYVNGQSYAQSDMSQIKYNFTRRNFDIYIGANTNGAQGIIGAIDEFRIYDGVRLWTSTFTPPASSFYTTHTFYPDIIRMPRKIASEWHYENAGTITDLINTNTAVQLNNLPLAQSRTGQAFYQTTQIKIFNIPTTKEVWIKFDVYFNGSQRWRAYDSSTGSGILTGITAQTDGRISFFNRNTNIYEWYNLGKINKLQTILLHMIADSTNGLIEAYTDDGGLLYAYTGEVNNGTNFGNLYLQSDGSGTFFSSIEISNSPLWLNERFLHLNFDVIRMPKIPATLWQYENAGTTADLINTNTAVQVNNLPQTKSKTGSAFYQTTENIALFDIATGTSEIWIKFDVYSQSYGWKIFDYTNYQSNSAIVVGILALCNYTPGTVIRFFNYDGNTHGLIADVSMSVEIDDALRTFILHMKADSTNGIIELFSDVDGLVYSFNGAVNGGIPFSKIDIVSGVDSGDADLFSNVIISNNPLWFYDNVSADISVSFSADAQRELLKSLLLSIDAERQIVGGSIQQSFYADVERVLAISTALSADTERDICADLSVNFDAERRLGNAVVVYFDAQRNITDEEIWRYENVGLLDELSNPSALKRQYYDLPSSKSSTGVAFTQFKSNEGIFPIESTNEVWIKFDVYRESGDALWFVGDRYSGSYSTSVNSDSWDNDDIDIWNTVGAGTVQIASVEDAATTEGLQTIIVHLLADNTDGIIEVYTDDGGLIYSFSGLVHVGMPFRNVTLYSIDGNNTKDEALFSNIVISNGRLDFTDNAHWPDISVTLDIDTQRVLTAQANYTIDAQRIVCSNSINVDLQVDAERYLDDYNKNISETFSTERILNNVVEISIDAQRNIIRNIVVPVYVPPEYNPPSHDAPVFPRPVDNSVIQSCTISMQEQQLTDNISFVYAAHVNIMDAVNLQFLDYLIRGRVEETTSKGILESCHLTCDVDEILYRQLAYEVPENKFEWTAEYLAEINRYNATHEEQVEKIPSAPASAHIAEIASKLGKNVSLQFTDFISTMSTTVQSGTNYAGLISELFGWTSRIPHLMINVYMRNETIYVIQRGQEQNTIVLDNAKLAEPTIKRKLMRMTWGSDPWSKTEVVSRMKEWSEFDQSPYNPPEESGEGGGGASYGDDNLVEETTVEHGEETVVTTYEYIEMGDGQKFLHKETAKTYSGGELVDTVVTTHEPVSYTQAHVYSTDDDGVIGGVVTNSNFDDRITPYQQEQIAGGGVAGHSDGMLVHDKDGNQYLLYGIAHHQDKEQIGNRTINGVTLIDTSFPVDGEAMLKSLTDAIKWLDRKTEESITIDVYDYPHVIDFNDKISLGGNLYYLRSNTVTVNEKIRNKQTIEIVRWY